MAPFLPEDSPPRLGQYVDGLCDTSRWVIERLSRSTLLAELPRVAATRAVLVLKHTVSCVTKPIQYSDSTAGTGRLVRLFAIPPRVSRLSAPSRDHIRHLLAHRRHLGRCRSALWARTRRGRTC